MVEIYLRVCAIIVSIVLSIAIIGMSLSLICYTYQSIIGFKIFTKFLRKYHREMKEEMKEKRKEGNK